MDNVSQARHPRYQLRCYPRNRLGGLRLGAVGFGFLFSHIGLTHIFIVANLFITLALTVAAFINKGNLQEATIVSKIAGYRALIYPLRHARFLALLISVFIVFTATASNASYYGLLIAELGATAATLDWVYFYLQ